MIWPTDTASATPPEAVNCNADARIPVFIEAAKWQGHNVHYIIGHCLLRSCAAVEWIGRKGSLYGLITAEMVTQSRTAAVKRAFHRLVHRVRTDWIELICVSSNESSLSLHYSCGHYVPQVKHRPDGRQMVLNATNLRHYSPLVAYLPVPVVRTRSLTWRLL